MIQGGIVSEFRMDPKIDKWTLQPGESTEGFACFVLYRDLGPRRSMREAARAQLRDIDNEFDIQNEEEKARRIRSRQSCFEDHSKNYLWKHRVRAYDAAMDRELIEARLAGQRDAVYTAGQRHGQLSLGILGIAMKYLEKFHDKKGLNKFAEERIEAITIGELMNITKTGVLMERMALGMDSARESADLSATIEGRQGRLDPEEAKRIAREAALEIKAQEPDPASIILKPPTE